MLVQAKEGGNEEHLWNGLTKVQSDQRISCLTYAQSQPNDNNLISTVSDLQTKELTFALCRKR